MANVAMWKTCIKIQNNNQLQNFSTKQKLVEAYKQLAIKNGPEYALLLAIRNRKLTKNIS